jgi:hypothetical protein
MVATRSAARVQSSANRFPASIGTEARTSATRSAMVTSVSCPIAVITGIFEL